MDVREVGNIYDACEQIVGKPLPRPVTSPRAPQLPSRAFGRLKVAFATWNARYSRERNLVNSSAKSTQEYIANNVSRADQLAGKATRDLNQILVGLACLD